MLRGTTEAFAAVAGGCDSLHVGAFDEVIRPPDEFSRRIARNTQIILRDECHFEQVIDPAGGSYYVETLTHQLAGKAWALFQEIEKAGGMVKALQSGVPQRMVNATENKKAGAVAMRRCSLIGTNVYANPTETPLETGDLEFVARQKQRAAHACNHRISPGQAAQTSVIARLGQILSTEPGNIFDTAVLAAGGGATLGELSRTLRARDGELPRVALLPVLRASEPFEKLRTAVAAAGKPKVFLANMGPLRQHKARADFSTSFFQAGGFTVEENRGFQTVALAIEAAQKSKACVVVICSTDETYPEIVPSLAALIKASRPKTIVVLAGYPKELVEPFKIAGVDEFIHMRANCYEVLRGIAGKLGINL
jgi:methylmalonyl-CoA mutase